MPLSADEYVEQRLEPEIAYYDRRASENKRLFHAVSLVAITTAAAVPVLSAADAERWLVAAAGAGASVAISALALLKWQEDWLQFRGNTERLKKEKALYTTRAGPYRGFDEDDLTEELTLRTEDLISREHQVWQRTHRDSQPPTKS